MFQGTVIDAETIYLGMKIEEGFESLAEAVRRGGPDDALRLICSAIKEGYRENDARKIIGSLRDRQQADSEEVRTEIRALRFAMVNALKQPDPPQVPVLETPNDLVKEGG